MGVRPRDVLREKGTPCAELGLGRAAFNKEDGEPVIRADGQRVAPELSPTGNDGLI